MTGVRRTHTGRRRVWRAIGTAVAFVVISALYLIVLTRGAIL
jgi:hypothetical protein